MKNRFAQLKMMFDQTREVDPRLVPYLLVAAAVGFAVPFVLFFVVLSGSLVIAAVLGVLTMVLAALVVFGRRVQKAQLAAIEGRPGAALAIVNQMRGPWFVTPAVAVTRKQDLVHRVVGRPGIILVGEGADARVKQLLTQEEKRYRRVSGDAPVHTVQVGDGRGQVPLKELRVHLTRLGRDLKKGQVADLDTKLAALGSSKLPMPKGPIPQSRPKLR